MFNKLKKNRLAGYSLYILGLFYFMSIFAGFFSVYHYDDENREFAYAPPSKIHFYDRENSSFGFFIYGAVQSFDENYQRIYTENKDLKYKINFFQNGRMLSVNHPARLYFWGADSRGRDIFSRALYGARVSLSVGLIGAFISFFLGMLIGGTAGYFGGRVDTYLMRLCEVFMLAPGFYLMLAIRAALPVNISSTMAYIMIIIIMSLVGWPGIARIIRGMALSLRERDFVLAARTQGIPAVKIIFRHIIPHTMSYALVAIALSIPAYILGEAGLSFIGLGIQDPDPSWGNLLSEAMNIVKIKLYPWLLAPGGLIFITVICFNLLGDALRDAFDARERASGA